MAARAERLGLLFAGLCAVNASFVPAFAKLTTNLADPMFVATGTTLFGAVAAAVVLWLRGELRLLVDPRVRWPLLLIGAAGTAVPYMLFFAGARRCTAIETVICLQSEPAYALLGAWLFLGHSPTPRRAAAIAVSLIGIVLAVGGHGFGSSSGVWLLLATPLCWQASHLIVLRRLVGVAPEALTGARYINGGLLLALCLLGSGGSAIPALPVVIGLLPLLVVQGLILSYVGTLLWYQAITRLDLARTTAIVVPSVPLLSLGASFLLLGETPGVWQLSGILLTAAGVGAFVTAPDARTGPAAEPAALARVSASG